MVKRKILAMAIAVCVLFSCAISVNAQANESLTDGRIWIENNSDEIGSRFSYTNSTATTLSISSSGVSTSTARLNGYQGTTTKVDITMTLQRKGGLFNLFWNDVTTWSQTFNSHSGTLSRTYNVSSGTYRVKAVYKAFSGNNSETITSYSGEVKY